MSKTHAEGAPVEEPPAKRVRGLPTLVERVHVDPTFADLPDDYFVHELLTYIDRPKEIGDAALIDARMARILTNDAVYVLLMDALFDRHYRSPLTGQPYVVCAVVRGAVGSIPGATARRKADLAYAIMSQVIRTTVENLFFSAKPRIANTEAERLEFDDADVAGGIGPNAPLISRSTTHDMLIPFGTSRIYQGLAFRRGDDVTQTISPHTRHRMLRTIGAMRGIPTRLVEAVAVIQRTRITFAPQIGEETDVGTGYSVTLGNDFIYNFIARFDPEPIWRDDPTADKWTRKTAISTAEAWEVGAYIALAYKPPIVGGQSERVYYRDTLTDDGLWQAT
jgi:hypothetical protein